MTLPALTEDRITATEQVAESFGRTNMLKHSEDVRKLKRRPPVSRLDQPVTIQIQSDLMPGLIDQYGDREDVTFEEWLSGFVSDALRGQLGL